MGPYVVIVGDRAGPVAERQCRTFAEALRLTRVVARSFPDQRTQVFNANRMDRDGDRFIDGLTDEERDQL